LSISGIALFMLIPLVAYALIISLTNLGGMFIFNAVFSLVCIVWIVYGLVWLLERLSPEGKSMIIEILKMYFGKK
jgi:bacteriorhodopsin